MHEFSIALSIIEIAEDEVYMDELTGYGLLNISTGKHGVISDFMDIPGNPVFEVRFEGAKILVPAQDDLIEEIDAKNQKMTMRLPDGIMWKFPGYAAPGVFIRLWTDNPLLILIVLWNPVS